MGWGLIDFCRGTCNNHNMDQAPPPRSSMGFAVLAFLAVAGSAVGVFVYQHFQGGERPATDLSGFDISQTSETPPPGSSRPGPLADGPPGRPESGLGMVRTGMTGMQFGAKGPQTQKEKADGNFSELCRNNEAKMRTLAQKYTRQYPAIARYGRDWMSYPDLKKLNDAYMRDHDPIKFLRGAAASPNFGQLVKKYATEPAIQSFVKDAMHQAPAGALSAAMDFLNQEGGLKSVVRNVAQALGLPTSLLDAAGSDPSKIDQKAVMDSVMKNNPDIQKAMGNQDVQKALGAPDAQRKLQNPSQ